MITGGTGPVDVTFSALTQTIQNLVTDEFSTFAVSETRIFLNVIDVATFSFDSRFRIGPNESTVIETQRLISEVVTLQFNQQYSVVISGLAVSRAGANEIPEPATVVLLVSGLGFMTGFVRKRRLKQ
jgi:2-keto-3-deoxy-galactonokinase